MKFVQLCAMNTTAMNAPETMMRSSMPRETMPASRRVGLRSIRLSRIGLHTERQRGRAIHDDVDPQQLQCGDGDRPDH